MLLWCGLDPQAPAPGPRLVKLEATFPLHSASSRTEDASSRHRNISFAKLLWVWFLKKKKEKGKKSKIVGFQAWNQGLISSQKVCFHVILCWKSQGWKKELFKKDFQSCRSAFKGKEGRKGVAWNREKGTKDQRFNSTGQILTAGNAGGEQQKGSERMENLKSLEINLKI